MVLVYVLLGNNKYNKNKPTIYVEYSFEWFWKDKLTEDVRCVHVVRWDDIVNIGNCMTAMYIGIECDVVLQYWPVTVGNDDVIY